MNQTNLHPSLSHSMWNFDKTNTFCISLEKSTDRRERIMKRFEYFHMDVSFCKATTGEETTDNFAHYLNSGSRGCAQSHINLWRHIVNNKLSYGLILEDDAMFDKKWKEKLNKLHLPEKWFGIFLNCSECSQYDVWKPAREQYLTGGYIISYEGASKLLEMFAETFYASDTMTTLLQTYGLCYTYFPWLIIQEGFDTMINSNVVQDHAKVIKILSQYNYDISENYV